MFVMTIEEIRIEAQTLPDPEKGILAEELLQAMEPPAYWVGDDEVHERVRQLESGEVEGITFEELKHRLGK